MVYGRQAASKPSQHFLKNHQTCFHYIKYIIPSIIKYIKWDIIDTLNSLVQICTEIQQINITIISFFYGHGANKQYTILTIQVKLTLDWRASKHQLLGYILVKIGWIHPSQDQLIFNGALTIPDCWDKYLLIYFIHL